jgi:hypothetical protein
MKPIDLDAERQQKAAELTARFEQIRMNDELNGIKTNAISEAIAKMVHAGIDLREVQAALRSAAGEIDEIISFEEP